MSDTTTTTTGFERTRNIAYARVWTAQPEPVLPTDIYDALYGRGFMPGFSDPNDETKPPMADAGLGEAVFELGAEGFRISSLTSARGRGCRITVEAARAEELPNDLLARRTVPRPKLVYIITAGGPSNSDRNLCENIAEALMLMTDGLVEVGGLGTKGNRPSLYASSWLGSIRTF